MRILVGCVFGIGNTVLKVPMLRALSTIGTVDVLIGSSGNDFGAYEVVSQLKGLGVISDVYRDDLGLPGITYDVAVMSIPFDGRWRNGVHYRAHQVLDSRPRPDPHAPLGFESWLRHEAEYNMDTARELGFDGPMPSSSFGPRHHVYLGIGYKRDAAGFWKAKDWGAGNYAAMMLRARQVIPGIRFFSTGNPRDWELAREIMTTTEVTDRGLFRFTQTDLDSSITLLRGCDAYVGNDTGMLHVAASLGLPCVALMAFPGTEVKNPPLGTGHVVRMMSDPSATPESVVEDLVGIIPTL